VFNQVDSRQVEGEGKTSMSPAVLDNLNISYDALRAFCQRWGVSEFAVFGSVLRADFRPDSDIDVMVTFADGSGLTLKRLLDMTEELEAMFGREVDLMTRQNIEMARNKLTRAAILESARVIYADG
jgi:hypothetical protein